MLENLTIGDEVYCWSGITQNFFKCFIHSISENEIGVLLTSNGKVYQFGRDGSSITTEGQTHCRIFPLKWLNFIDKGE